MGPTYVSNQLLFLKYSHIFLNYDFAPFWAYWAIFNSLGVIFWLEVRFKTFFLSTKGIHLGENSSIFFYLIWPHLGLFLHFSGPFGAFFWPFGAYCVVGVRFKNIFGTYLCRKSTLVLEIQPYLFVYNLAKFGAFFTFFGPFEAIFGVGVKFKNFF